MRINTWKRVLPILSVLLFAIYPVLVLYAHNVDQLVLKQFFLPIIISVVLSTIFFGLWLIILKEYLQASLATVFLLVIFWNYGLLYMGITKLVGLKHWHLMPLLLVIYLHVVYFITKTKQPKTLYNLNSILFLPIFLLIIINVITILPAEFKKNNTLINNHKVNRPAHEASDGKDAGKYYPDIYLIILDEYASLSTIKEEWGYDNSEFAEFLRNRGFFVTEASETRYSQTEWNMSSLLNIDYLTGPVEKNFFLNFVYDPKSIKGSKKYKILQNVSIGEKIQKISNNFLTTYLKEHGYRIVVLEGISQYYSWYNIHNADISFSYQDVIKSNKYSFLIDAFYMELIRKSIIFAFDTFFIIDQTFDINYAGTKYVFNYLKTEVYHIDSPKFIYAHLMCPHSPFVFSREGNYVSPAVVVDQREGGFVTAKNTVNDAYLEQYIYVTNEIKRIVNSHIQHNSPAGPIFIIQSDHGPRPHALYLKDKTSSFKVFNAVYFPDDDYRDLYGSIAPVNTLRVVLNKYFGENYNMLKEK